MEYSILKLIHLGALILWLGPAFGAWIVLKFITSEQPNSTTAKVNQAFFTMITLEHVAFIALLASGFLMAHTAGWFASPWLSQKLMIVGAIIIPLEIIDIVLGNWLAAKASAKLSLGTASPKQVRWLALYHGPFTKLALFVIPTTVVLVMYLAVSKAPLF